MACIQGQVRDAFMNCMAAFMRTDVWSVRLRTTYQRKKKASLIALRVAGSFGLALYGLGKTCRKMSGSVLRHRRASAISFFLLVRVPLSTQRRSFPFLRYHWESM